MRGRSPPHVAPTATPSPSRDERDALGAEANRDPLALEDLADAVRDVLVLAGDEARRRSMTVTSRPNRRYICANSSPT